ncbi:iron-containing redox enzyme family protein [Streptomyces sp. NBC_00102]|uniref:iron-containing redox enzyme family protein n=1 Tax=Streptomyces sp. NBC_00102 TaxID=2975652 RepID=UPI00225B00C8|nr:iron-containing redox enzyme family protein [Streptomyces sp. NBC_00102]MCX5398299.1 iron-containing redox enzyme family protein [Streptomyces sp. NBC_00102]
MHGPTATVPYPAADPAPDSTSTARNLYVRVTDPECLLPDGPLLDALRAELARGQGAPGADVAALRSEATAWCAEEERRYGALLERATAAGARESLVRKAALASAPLALHSGAWLQWLSGPGNADDPAALRVLSLYASDVGVGHPHASRGSAYLTVLRRLRLAEYAVPGSRLAQDERVGDAAFHVPAVLLALGRRPDDFRAEVLGADLCLRTLGLLPPLRPLRAAHPDAGDWTAVDAGAAREPGGTSAAESALDAVAALAEDGPGDTAGRVVNGFAWALEAVRAWSEDLYVRMEQALDPAYDMAELLRLRAREGAVYHDGFPLEGKPLSRWLTESMTDPGPLLGALARSRMVKPGRADSSSLVNGLVGERGPMFRVFSDEDLVVVRRWIDALPPRDAAPVEPADHRDRPAPERLRLAVPGRNTAATDPGRAPSDLREAYWMLQTRAGTPALLQWADEYVRGWLARSGHGMADASVGLPAVWPAGGLRPWLRSEHDRHGTEFTDGADIPLPSREALVDSTVQLAPLTLIDGGWLQGFTDYEQASSEIGFSLFETYWDELGNGEPRLNHPLIYREVLTEMGVELPPTGSRAFSLWDGFDDASFELPVYWLCVGRFPRTFLPEVLGLNLAMELSGVGGSYRRARIALKEYGFSTRFVDIHNTIDNVSSGHSAWAADAVDSHLSGVASSAVTETWARVRAGYRSLNPPSGLRARRAQRRARRTAPTPVRHAR